MIQGLLNGVSVGNGGVLSGMVAGAAAGTAAGVASSVMAGGSAYSLASSQSGVGGLRGFPGNMARAAGNLASAAYKHGRRSLERPCALWHLWGQMAPAWMKRPTYEKEVTVAVSIGFENEGFMRSKRTAVQTIPNPYLDNRREWNERYGSYIAQARNWRFAAVVALLLALVCAGGPHPCREPKPDRSVHRANG